METITLTEAFAVVYAPDDFGSKTIINMLPISLLSIPQRLAVGKTGKDIKWSAHKDAVVTEDYRNE